MEIIDLLPPIERLGEVYRKFVAKLEKKLAEDEKRLDETFETHRAMLHRVHQKTVNSYEVIFNQMLKKLEQQEDIPLVIFFEKAMRSKNIHMYSKAVENLQPNLDNVEENGGDIVFSSKITDGSSSHFNQRGNYFCYFDDFWGIDDVVFKVKKEYATSHDKKIETGNKEPSLEEELEALRAVASDIIPEYT
jgi:hypothetical protein